MCLSALITSIRWLSDIERESFTDCRRRAGRSAPQPETLGAVPRHRRLRSGHEGAAVRRFVRGRPPHRKLIGFPDGGFDDSGSWDVSADRIVLHESGRGVRRQEKTVAFAYSDTRDARYEDLARVFLRGSAQIALQLNHCAPDTPDLERGLLFVPGHSEVKPGFQEHSGLLLSPLVRILRSAEVLHAISEIVLRTSHHTDWIVAASPADRLSAHMVASRSTTDHPCAMC